MNERRKLGGRKDGANVRVWVSNRSTMGPAPFQITCGNELRYCMLSFQYTRSHRHFARTDGLRLMSIELSCICVTTL